MSYPLRFLCSLLFLCLPALAFAQAFDPAARVAAIAPFLDEHTIAVGHVDLKRIDPAAAIRTIGDLAPQDDIDFRKRLVELEAGLSGVLKSLSEAGVSDVYLVASIADIPQNPPFLVAPIKAGGNTQAAAELLSKIVGLPARAEIGGAAVVAKDEAIIERLKTLKPTPRPELAKAFEIAGDTAAQLVFSPTDDTRRVLREMLPRLPDEIGGGSGKMLADGVQWAVISANAPPKLSLDVRVQSKDEDSAVAVRGLVISAIQLFRDQAKLAEAKPEERAAAEAVIRLITPQVKGSQLVISRVQDDAEVQTLLKAVVPAVQAARTAAGRNQSVNNLKQIALAMHNYHDTYTRFPAQAIRSKDGKPLLSWRVAILPFIEHQSLYEQFHLDEPWDSEHNKKLIEKMPPYLASPSLTDALRAKGMTTYLAPLSRKPPGVFHPDEAQATPPGGQAIFDDPQGTRLSAITDGTSNTIMVLEAHPKSAVIWSKPDDLVVDEKKMLAALEGQASAGFNAAFADGSVRFISESVDPKILWLMLMMNDGTPIPQ
jgi:prepilin-type processing-associated H-X9-DG protein